MPVDISVIRVWFVHILIYTYFYQSSCFCYWMSVQWCLIVVLVFVSLITNTVKYFAHTYWHLFIFCEVFYSRPFFLGGWRFLRHSLCIVHIRPLLDIVCYQYILPLCGLRIRSLNLSTCFECGLYLLCVIWRLYF